MKSIAYELLAGVCGGMRWEDLPPSQNVEDRRHLSRRESMRVRSRPVPPSPPEPRFPGDLPSQLGIDHIRRGRRW
jgi:hypothetical protein